MTTKSTDGETQSAHEERVWTVHFEVAGQSYSLPREAVDEIVPMAELTCPLGGPRMLAGFLNLAGTPIPVVRVAELFGIEQPPVGMYTPLIILNGTTNQIAIQVDRVTSVIPFTRSDILSVPEDHSFNNCATGLLKTGGTLSLLLDSKRLLLDQEKKRLQDLQSIEKERLAGIEEVVA